jgi:hypothetical protein
MKPAKHGRRRGKKGAALASLFVEIGEPERAGEHKPDNRAGRALSAERPYRDE